MKKRIAIGLLMVILTFVVFTFAVTAAETGVYCPHCDQYVTNWTEWTAQAGGSHSQTTGGHFYLAKDFKGMGGRYGINSGSETVVIDLRGHTIESTNNRAFFVNGGTLAIMDSVGNGTVIGARDGDGNLYVAAGARIDMYGGTVKTSRSSVTSSTACGSVLFVLKDGTFNLYGGTLDGSAITTRNTMSGTACVKGTLNVYGGTIRGGNSTNGGNVYLDGGTLYMTGGTITGGQAVNGGNIYTKNAATVTISCDKEKNTVATVTKGHATSTSGLGGNLCVNGGSTVTLSGGKITDGISDARGGNISNGGANTYNITSGEMTGGAAGTDGANMFVNNGSVALNISGGYIDGGMDIRLTSNINLSGDAVITENRGGLVLNMGTPQAKIKPGAFKAGASVAVAASGAFTDALTDAEAFLQYIKSGSNALQLSAVDGKLTAGVVCPHCNKIVEWAAWTDALGASHSRTTGGHFYLTANVSGTSRYKIDTGASNEAVVLDLRGHNITSTGDRLFYVTSGKLAIVDSVGTGVLKGARNGDGNIRIDGGQVDMYGGTVVTSRTEIASTGCGSIVYVGNAAGVFNLYGGALDGSNITTPAATSGTVYTKGTFRIYGGRIIGGKANNGGNIYVSATGKLVMEDGVVSGGHTTGYGGNIYVVAGGSFTMTGGEIFGGVGDTDANDAYNSDNVYVGGAMVMSGGKINAAVDADRILTENDKLGNGILCWAGARLTLDGNASVLNEEKSGNIYVGSTGGITVKKNFTGEASLAVVEYYHLSNPVLGGVMTGANDVAEGPYTGKLYLEGDYDYPRIYGQESGKLIVGGIATVNDMQGQVVAWCGSLADIAQHYTEGRYIKLYVDQTFVLPYDVVYVLDLNGHNITAGGVGKLLCFDSANADLKTYGTVQVSGSVSVVNGSCYTFDKPYYTVCENGVYSFHILTMEVNKAAVRPSACGVYYGGIWQCDSKLAEHIDTYGVAVSVYEMPDTLEIMQNQSLWTAFSGSDFTSGGEKTGVMIADIMKTEEEASADRVAQNAVYGATPIFASVYTVIDGNYYFSDEGGQAAYSLKTLLEAIDTKITEDPVGYGGYLDALQEFCKKYPALASYEFENFGYDFVPEAPEDPMIAQTGISAVLGPVLYQNDFEKETVNQLPEGWSAGYYNSGNTATNTSFGWTGSGGYMTPQVVELEGYGKVYQFSSSNADAFTAMPQIPTNNYLYEAKIKVMRKGAFGLVTNTYAPVNEATGAFFTGIYPATTDNTRYVIKGQPAASTNYWAEKYNPAVGDVVTLQILCLDGKNYMYCDGTLRAIANSRAGSTGVDHPGIYTCGGGAYVLEVTVTSVLSVEFDMTSAGLTLTESGAAMALDMQADKDQAIYQQFVGGDYTEDCAVKFGAVIKTGDEKVEALRQSTRGAKVVWFAAENIHQDDNTISFSAQLPLTQESLDKWFTVRPFAEFQGIFVYGEAVAYNPVNLANGAYHSTDNEELKALIENAFGGFDGFIANKSEKKVTFTLFSDFHYRAGMYPTTIADLNTILKRADDTNSAFVLSAGDFTNDAMNSPELFKAFLNYKTAEGTVLPAYNIYGNHELEIGNTMAYMTPLLTNDKNVFWGTEDGSFNENIGYYCFEREGFRIICLDTEYSYNPTTNVWEHNKSGSSGWPSGNIKGGSLGPQQLAWLEAVLMDAASKDVPCIVVAHDGFSGLGWATTSPDAETVRGLYAKANKANPGTVLMSINGHMHTNHQGWNDGVFYFDTNTVRNAWWQETKVDHYTEQHTFMYEEYDDEGNLIATYEKPLGELTMAQNTWFSEDPLSCVITVSADGKVTVDGAKSDWAYGIAPSNTWEGVMCEITSGIFWDCERYGHTADCEHN